MNNPGYGTLRVFEGIDNYDEKLVAFVDVMGVTNRMRNSLKPHELQMFSLIMHAHAYQPFAQGKISIVSFSDCMYLITDGQYYKELICLLSNFSYTLLVNREVNTVGRKDGGFEEKVLWDCLKLRGGITYGKVLTLDDIAEKRNVATRFNMVIGPAAINAYELESKKALYPRIIVDDAFGDYIKNAGITYDECFMVRDNMDDYYYLDFWNYMFHGTKGPVDFLNGCIQFVKKEIEEANSNKDERLIRKLSWYLKYLKRHQDYRGSNP